MPSRTCLAIILAAGEGTRMRSHLPKVLHALGGRSLLAHVILAARAAGSEDLAVVVGLDHDAVTADALKYAPKAQIFVQRERRGTAHAVLSVRGAIARGVDDVVVMFGDTPLVQAETLSRLRGALADGAAVAVLG
ncbi:MAG TPA: NTP transferase domain-containing protein, partial [Pseudolabrys sp.]|nr:NTP transferase domain-containing protein [Pseudolabrys sp.]